jgi:hypothetical protein
MRATPAALALFTAILLVACGTIVGLDHTYVEDTGNVDGSGAMNGDGSNGADGSNVIGTGDGSTDAGASVTCDADLSSDPLNCGACGRACGGDSGCAASRCAPVLLVPGQVDPPLVLVTGNLYWVDQSSHLMTCVTPSCATPTQLAELNTPHGFGVAGTQKAFAIEKSGPSEVSGTTSVDCNPGGGWNQQSMIGASDRVYVSGTAGLFECKDGCNSGTPCTKLAVAQPSNPGFSALAGGSIWFLDSPGLRRCAVSGDTCTMQDVDAGVVTKVPSGSMQALTADSTGAFLVETVSNKSSVLHVDSLGVTTILTTGTFTNPNDVTLDTSHLFIATDTSILVMPKLAATPATLAGGLSSANAIVAEPNDGDMYVYFADGMGIWRLRK